MRAIGKINDQALAERFGDFLYGQGIENEIEGGSDGSFVVWVLDDEQVEEAHGHLAAYLEDPAAAAFAEGARQGREAFERDAAEARDRRAEVIDARSQLDRPGRMPGLGFATIGLTALPLFVYLLQVTTGDGTVEQALMIGTRGSGFLEDVLSGQVWRLWTPMLLHFGLIHILFNAYMTYNLASLVEEAHGSAYLISVSLSIALFSNLAQYAAGGPAFGGMSGVVYGLFGFLWLRGSLDRRAGYQLPGQLVAILLIWFVLCAIGFIPNVANWAHGAGLAIGAGAGAFTAMVARSGRD